MASARGLAPPKAAMMSEWDLSMGPVLKTLCLERKPVSAVSLDSDKKSYYGMGRPMRSDTDKELMKRMGRHLRWVRKALGESQETLAAHVGVHQTSWSFYERGLRWPDSFSLVRLTSKLKITAEYLKDGDLRGVDRDLAIRLAAAHPELVPPIDKGPRTGTDQS